MIELIVVTQLIQIVESVKRFLSRDLVCDDRHVAANIQFRLDNSSHRDLTSGAVFC